MTTQFTNRSPFINRQQEIAFLESWVAEEANNILFIYGPKSSGKTTLLYRFVRESLANGNYDIKHFNLREILIVQYQDFIKTFFEHDYSKDKGDVKEKREYDLKVFKLSVETLKGLNDKELDPFVVMKQELLKLNDRGIRPVIIIDELQALEGIYMNGQRELLKELFNFFVAMTKESHLCHVIIASSDGYFIERIYSDSKLKKTSKFLEIDYLRKDDVYYWLNNLKKESAITKYTLTSGQVDRIWEIFGGSCWEISRFLGDILMRAAEGKVPDSVFEEEQKKVLIQMRSLFEDYSYTPKRKAIFHAVHAAMQTDSRFSRSQVFAKLAEPICDEKELYEDLGELVRQNFLAYNPVTATYMVQGRTMEIGLAMYVEMIKEVGKR